MLVKVAPGCQFCHQTHSNIWKTFRFPNINRAIPTFREVLTLRQPWYWQMATSDIIDGMKLFIEDVLTNSEEPRKKYQCIGFCKTGDVWKCWWWQWWPVSVFVVISYFMYCLLALCKTRVTPLPTHLSYHSYPSLVLFDGVVQGCGNSIANALELT